MNNHVLVWLGLVPLGALIIGLALLKWIWL